jgi:hemerythrin
MFVQWSDEKYGLGIPEIDRQHQELFLITNQLHECSLSEERSCLESILKRLYAYTKYHFNSEEAMFKNYGYPQMKSHLDIHGDFTLKVKDQLDWLRKNPLNPLDDIIDFLVSWIINHIHGEDLKYRNYFREKNIEVKLNFSQNKSGGSTLEQDSLSLWKKKNLSLEIDSIDREHIELVHIMQQFNDLQRARLDRQDVFLPVFIEKLIAYAEYHFTHEEQLMAQCNYPDMQTHRDLHLAFIQKAQDFKREYDLHKESLLDEVILFLKEWVVNHILEEDAKYKVIFQRKLGLLE